MAPQQHPSLDRHHHRRGLTPQPEPSTDHNNATTEQPEVILNRPGFPGDSGVTAVLWSRHIRIGGVLTRRGGVSCHIDNTRVPPQGSGPVDCGGWGSRSRMRAWARLSEAHVAAGDGPLVVLFGQQSAGEAYDRRSGGKMPTTLVRRRIWLLSRSWGLLDQGRGCLRPLRPPRSTQACDRGMGQVHRTQSVTHRATVRCIGRCRDDPLVDPSRNGSHPPWYRVGWSSRFGSRPPIGRPSHPDALGRERRFHV